MKMVKFFWGFLYLYGCYDDGEGSVYAWEHG